MRIKTKIVMLAFLAILLSVGLMGVSMYLYISPILGEQTVRDNQAIVEKVAQQVSFTLEDTITYAKGIIINDQLQALLKRATTASGYDYYSTASKINRLLKEYSFLRDNLIVDMAIVGPDGRAMELSGVYYSDLDGEWFDEFRDNRTYNGISRPHSVVAPSNLSRLDVMTYVINIYDKENPSGNVFLCKLLIHLSYDALVKPMLTDPSLGVQLAVFDRAEHVIYAPADVPPNTLPAAGGPAPNVSYEAGRYYIAEAIPAAGWTIVGTISRSKINASLTYFNYAMATIFLICLLFMTIIIYPAASGATKPLLKLVRGMRQVGKGEFGTSIAVRSGDEIEEAAQVFNRMVRDIKQLLDESVQQKKKEMEMELKMFMLQINPHFIWNTLNAVIFLARKANAPDIVALTKAFISFLQTTIRNHPQMLAGIGDEMRYIEDYCLILKYRYNDAVELIWQVDEASRAHRIPKMILYPLVENSIFHGILPAMRKGWIRIAIRADESVLHVSVEDNGVGIDPPTLERLRAQMAAPAPEEDLEHIGLLNVNSRLKLLFGEGSMLRIDNGEAGGALVRFAVPLSLLASGGDPKNI